MNKKQTEMIRLARRIQDRLLAGRGGDIGQLLREMSHASDTIEQLASLQHKLELCRQWGFLLAAQQLRQQVAHSAGDLIHEIQAVQRQASQTPPYVPSLGELVQDLRQLELEFDKWEFDAETQGLSVKTESIELEDVPLGPFQIVLWLEALGDNRRNAVKVIALDPHPAACNEAVTHPHVSDENLCTGDASAAIQAALASGRITDLFILVRSVLQTYNSNSPYVALENWDGQSCSDCGYVTNDEDRYCCQGCENDFCSECISCCERCDTSYCRQCIYTCPSCDCRCCRDCLEACDECGKDACCNCRVDGLCPECHEQMENSNEQQSEQSQESTQPNEAAIAAEQAG